MSNATATGQRERSMTQEGQSSIDFLAISPEQVKRVLLSDNEWHNVANCSITQFAVAKSYSPPSPSKLYPSLRFSEGSSTIVVPLNQVRAIAY